MSALLPTESHCSTGPVRCSTMITQQDLVWEVLVRVPTKSLMRFKCVSKLWYSIIRNPKFAIAHNNGGSCFRGLLITDIHYSMYAYCLLQKIFYVNINDDCPRLMQHHFTIRESQDIGFTSVVKGLIGLYNNDSLTLCNIATQEFLKLPPTPRPSSYHGILHFYFLGFDPVEEVYKVLNICIFYLEYIAPTFQSHVFTLGFNYLDMNWRKTIAPTSLGLYFKSQQCLSINGALYLLREEARGGQQTLTVFHLNSETFETIAIPECTQGGADLVEISGRPALVTTDYFGMLDVWTMNNHCGLGELEAWTRKKVWLPTNSNIFGKLNYAGMLPTGEIMLAESKLYNFPFAIYIYDHLKNKLKSIKIDGYGSQESGMELKEMKICYYEENIISLAFLRSRKQYG